MTMTVTHHHHRPHFNQAQPAGLQKIFSKISQPRVMGDRRFFFSIHLSFQQASV